MITLTMLTMMMTIEMMMMKNGDDAAESKETAMGSAHFLAGSTFSPSTAATAQPQPEPLATLLPTLLLCYIATLVHCTIVQLYITLYNMQYPM